MWTKQQLEAIEKSGENIIVSAGAGSGKTAVLTNRILRLIKEGIPLNRILVLTFTKASAKEMKERLRKLLIKEKLHNHLADLQQAYITTFDSYSLSLCKKYFYKLNLSPHINICDGVVIKLKKKELINDYLYSLYENKDKRLFDFLDKFAFKNDDFLVNFILELLESISLFPNSLDYLNNYLNNYFNQDYFNTLLKEYFEVISLELVNLAYDCKDLYEISSDSLEDKLKEFLEFLNEPKDYNGIYRYFSSFSLPRLKTGSSEELKLKKKEFTDNIKSFLNNFLIYDSEEHIIKSVFIIKDDVSLILDILNNIIPKIDSFKREYNQFEFIDIAKMALKLVKENIDIKNEIKNNLKEILIDEYQDTSLIQEEFINEISSNNVFMVGDIKQSIYRFRDANPYIFKKKYQDYSNNINGSKIDLNLNFRSREEVVSAINTIFANIMTYNYGDADYKKDHIMHFGNENYITNKDNIDYNIEILQYDDQFPDYSYEEKEAFIIAKDILKKINQKIMKNNTLKDCEYSDFCIILDNSKHFLKFKKILEYFNIPVSIEADIDIRESDLNKVISNIFALVDLVKKDKINNEYFYYFTSIARSFLFSLSDEFIFNEVKTKSIDNIIYTKALLISKYVDKKSNEFIFDEILKEFEVFLKLSSIKNTYDSLIQIDYIKTIISNLSSLGYTFSDISSHLKEIKEFEDKITYPFYKQSINSVKIMTIHHSKGLEFPICYFPMLHMQFNIMDLNKDFSFSSKYNILIPSYDEGSYKSILYRLFKHQEMKELISEKIRVFYVALTRAKEKIVLIYHNKEYQQKYSLANNYRCFGHFIFSIYEVLTPFITNIDLNQLDLNRMYLSSSFSKRLGDKEELDFINNEYFYKSITKEKISASVNKVLSVEERNNIKKGLLFHEILESLDFNNLNLDLLASNNLDYQFISDILKLDIFKNISTAKVYQEYEFMTTIDDKSYHGIIDLLVEYDDYIDIIDYKLYNVDKEEYVRQLHIYKEYVNTKTNKRINMYLLSLGQAIYKKIE